MNKRLNEISSNEAIFKESIEYYEDALKKVDIHMSLITLCHKTAPNPKIVRKNQEKEMKHGLTLPGMQL